MDMDMMPKFASKDEEIEYWKNLCIKYKQRYGSLFLVCSVNLKCLNLSCHWEWVPTLVPVKSVRVRYTTNTFLSNVNRIAPVETFTTELFMLSLSLLLSSGKAWQMLSWGDCLPCLVLLGLQAGLSLQLVFPYLPTQAWTRSCSILSVT